MLYGVSYNLLLSFKEKEHCLSNGYSTRPDPTCSEVPQLKERLCNKEILRYSRQLILPEIGVKGLYDLENNNNLLIVCYEFPKLTTGATIIIFPG